MRILSWNINGIRTLPQYHPWNTFKTCEGVLNELHADIICFQEMKSSRAAIERHVALPPSYDAFLSFPIAKGGYSGVAVYTSALAVPLKAEEGIVGRLQPKPPLSEEERIGSYPTAHELENKLFPDEKGDTPSDLGVLDAEGRGLVLDLGLFVLINVYCPNETSDARLPFKMNYHLALEERVRKLVAAGREVIVLGDINICATPLDHCDGHLPSNQEGFYRHPARKWFQQWTRPQGPMVDVVRTFHEGREGMFTCWNMKIMARETNYGTRVDYILVTPGLLPWIKHGDIQPLLKGSDHCPIYIDLHDSVIDFEGRTRTLREEMQMPETEAERRAPPRIATKNWDEYSGKQKLLSNFFGKAKAKSPDSPVDSTPLEVSSPPTTIVQSGPLEADPPVAAVDATLASATIEISTQPSVDSTTPSASPDVELVPQPPNTTTTSVLARTPMKRKAPKASNPSGSDAYDAVVPKRQKGKAGIKATPSKGKGKAAQQSIATFFGKPAAKPSTQSSTSDVLVVGGDGDPNDDADYQLALKLSQETDSGIPLSQNTLATSRAADPAETKAAWSNMFAKTEAPRCPMHDEPAKAFTVNKTGPNKGRAFYVCARPVGPGYDKGRNERLRSEVDRRYKCDFFMWASDVRKNRDTATS